MQSKKDKKHGIKPCFFYALKRPKKANFACIAFFCIGEYNYITNTKIEGNDYVGGLFGKSTANLNYHNQIN